MPGTMQKIKLLKLYELLQREMDEDHPISRIFPSDLRKSRKIM